MEILVLFLTIFVVYQLIYHGIPKEKRGGIHTFHVIFSTVTGVLVLAAAVLGSFYTIAEQEQAVLVTLGKASAVTDTGLHFKIPFIQKVIKVDTTIKGMPIGFREEDDQMVEKESLMITSDYNFVNIDFFVEYQVTDPVRYLYASNDPVLILKNIAQSSIRDTVGQYDVDAVITTGKNEIQGAIKELIISKLEEEDIGLALVNLTIQDAVPPTEEINAAFKAVETAKQGMETALNTAEKYYNQKIPEANAQADQILQSAQVTKTQRINQAYEEIALFQAKYKEYAKNKEVTRLRMFYETMEEILPDVKVVIGADDGSVTTLYPLESFTGQNSTGSGTENNVGNGNETGN